MNEIALRPYQLAAINALWKHFETQNGNPLLVMPTGTGKSLVIAAICERAICSYPDEPCRILVLAHVRELLQQNHAALLQLWPDAPAGIYSAGLNRRDLDARILFAGIQSIHKKAAKLQRVDLVLVDEAHLIGREAQGMYRRFLKELNEINAGMLKVVGTTATPFRMDTGRLDEGADAMFQRICYEADIGEMIEAGYLSHLETAAGHAQIDTSNVATRGGEFVLADLEAAARDENVNRAIVDEIVTKGEGRGSWLVFGCGVEHAFALRDLIRQWGIKAETITGETPTAERDRVIEAYRNGTIRALTNANVLTTGFDAPGTDLVALVRPTKSIGLYVQMCGRGTRTAPGKDDALVLDFGGCIARFGPLDRISGRKRAKGEEDEPGKAPFKICGNEECGASCAASARVCFQCGFEFPPPVVKLAQAAAALPIVARFAKIEWLDVLDVTYGRHTKPDKPDSLVVNYHCGIMRHREWVLLEHGGYPREKAVAWWQRRAPAVRVPNTVNEALEQTEHLAKPIAITVRPVGQYTEIVGVRFA